MKSTLQRPILQQLIGRTNDIAVLPSGKSAGLTLPLQKALSRTMEM
jgi:hypothetical protein